MTLIVFASPKGGVGKTTLAAHTAALLAERGHPVLALDLDPQNALRLQFGLPLQEEEGLLASLLQPEPPSWRSLVRETRSGVRVLPHGTLDPMQTLELGQLLMQHPALLTGPLREMLAEPGQVVVVDSAPGPTPALRAVTPLASLLVMVLLADAASASLLPQIASGRVMGRGVLAMRAAERTALVLNQVALDQPLSAAVLEAAEQAMGDRMIGAVGYDPAVAEALAGKRLLLTGGGAAEDFRALADAVAARLKLVRPMAAGRDGARGTAFPALSEWGLR